VFSLNDIVGYIENYGKGSSNSFQKLINVCKSGGKEFADILGIYDKLDMDVLMEYFDMSMTTLSAQGYKTSVLFDRFSTVVKDAEEAFGLLVLENNFDRWMYQAEVERMKLESRNNFDIVLPPMVDVPDVLYQKKVKKRRNNVQTVGKWTAEGIERYDKILNDVIRRREDREDFEVHLKEEYNKDVSEGHKCRIEVLKRKMEVLGDEVVMKKPKKEMVTDVLKIEEL